MFQKKKITIAKEYNSYLEKLKINKISCFNEINYEMMNMFFLLAFILILMLLIC